MDALDTDVLLLAFAFQRDARQEANRLYLEQVQRTGATVPVYALMELLGQLSFNLSAADLAKWPLWLQDHYRLTITYPEGGTQDPDVFFRQELVQRPLDRMQRFRTAYLDGLIVDLVERTPGIDAFVTWNARHFAGKTAVLVLTPEQAVHHAPDAQDSRARD